MYTYRNAYHALITIKRIEGFYLGHSGRPKSVIWMNTQKNSNFIKSTGDYRSHDLLGVKGKFKG